MNIFFSLHKLVHNCLGFQLAKFSSVKKVDYEGLSKIFLELPTLMEDREHKEH